MRVCGEFGTTSPDGVHRDLNFTVRSFDSNPGPGRPNGFPRICGFPVDVGPYQSFLENTIRDTLVNGVNDTLRNSVVQREVPAPGDAIPGTCSSTLGGVVRRSRCANPAPGLTPDQDCLQFLTGDPNSTAIRARCEARSTGVSCTLDSDCGGSRSQTGRRCVIEGFCADQRAFTTDANCDDQPCNIRFSECVDAEPVCYWNAEVDGVEILPSGLNVVLAEDEGDATFQMLRRLGIVEASGFCREPMIPSFIGVAASGVLGPASGAPLP